MEPEDPLLSSQKPLSRHFPEKVETSCIFTLHFPKK